MDKFENFYFNDIWASCSCKHLLRTSIYSKKLKETECKHLTYITLPHRHKTLHVDTVQKVNVLAFFSGLLVGEDIQWKEQCVQMQIHNKEEGEVIYIALFT